MLRRSATSLFFNRADLKREAAALSKNHKLNILVGPPSCGKTALIKEVTKEEWGLHWNLRRYGTDDQDVVVEAFKRELLDVIEPGRAVSANLAKIADGVCGSDKAFRGLATLLHGESLTALGVIDIFDRVLTRFAEKRKHVFVFIDEYPELFSKGDASLKWKDHVAHSLEKVLVRHTKEVSENFVTAVITSSDPQYYGHFADMEKREFAKTTYLGYMPHSHVLEYLEKELNVKDKETRHKIADHAGGHFTVLKDLAGSKDVDAEIKLSKMKNHDFLEMDFAKLSREAQDCLTKTLIPEFLANGFASSHSIPSPIRTELVCRNMVSVRGRTADAVWSPDLPEAARKFSSVLTPFVPTQRHVFGDLGKK